MRDYSKVSSQFWTGKTGKALRGDVNTQLVALYLMTSPHANMIGVFHCPVIYISHETGIPLEGASKALQRLVEGGFCTYDEDAETVWVHEMAKFQIGDELKPTDNRVKDIRKQVASLPIGYIKQGFIEKYRDAFHLSGEDKSKPLPSPFEDPSKPGTGTGTGTGTGDKENTTIVVQKKNSESHGSRLPEDWTLPSEWEDWAKTTLGWLPAKSHATAAMFRDYWHSQPGQKGRKSDWFATWRNWCRKAQEDFARSPPPRASPSDYTPLSRRNVINPKRAV